MSTSFIILMIIILLVMFGAGQRILDSLRLSDKSALLILLAISVGLIIPPIWIGEYFCFSIGGFLIPLALSIYLLISCGFSRDLARAVVGTVIVAGVIYGLEWVLPADPEAMIIDNTYVYGVVAGVVAYALGRSRRNAFISCLFGLTLASVIQWIINFSTGTPSILGLGVGGAFGAYIVSIVISVAVSEFLGRAFQTASLGKEQKVYNYETGSYDSEKNGKLEVSQGSEDYRIADLENVKSVSYDTKKSNSQKITSTKTRKRDIITKQKKEKE